MTQVKRKRQGLDPISMDLHSLTELTLSMEQIWLDLAKHCLDKVPKHVPSLPLQSVAEYLVKESIALDLNKALEVIQKIIGPRLDENVMRQSEFNKFFQKGVFKDQLIKIANSFDNNNHSLGLGYQLSTFQRRSMLKGINREHESHQDIKRILRSLQQLMCTTNPDFLTISKAHFMEVSEEPEKFVARFNCIGE
jgi:hypothetical protein